MARLLDHDVVVVDFEDADVVLAHEALDAAAARHLVEGDLLLHHFVGGVDEGLQHVDLLFDLPHQLFDPFRSGADDDRELMDARQRRLGGREALDIDVAAGENRGDLVQQTHLVFDRYGNAVFMIFTSDGSNGYQGSGFFVSNDGLAVSNYHVFKGTTIGREQIKLAGSNKSYSVAKVLHKSEKEDFIVFMVNCQNTNYIPIAKSKPRIGDKVYAIGSPRGLENTFSSGEVSQWRADNLMQISALIDHGSSGGALINEYGEVVGITSGSFADGSQANLNYAWSIDVVKPYIK